MKHKLKMWYLFSTSVIALMALVMATYAWFTTNRKVSTSVATARTGEENLELQISSSGGADFRDSESVAIQQVNSTDAKWLTPVSTSDLTQFVYCPATVDGKAVSFEPVNGEAGYYHGRVYLKAVGEGWPDGSKMELYLDQSDGVLGSNVDGRLLNASRLGLLFDGDASSAVILRLSDSQNPEGEQAYNTVINGKTLGEGQVLVYNNGSVGVSNDPSYLIDDFTVKFDNGSVDVPDDSLFTMEFGKIYQLDIYFYLEGCDPDCSDSVSFDAADIHLAFYGILSQGGR